MFQNPFSFEGRIRRTEYGISLIIYCCAAVLINIIGAATNFIFLLFLYIPLLWFIWAQGAKRCHHRGNSGAWQLIPFYGLWMLFADGEPKTDSYGTDPKGRCDLVEQLLA